MAFVYQKKRHHTEQRTKSRFVPRIVIQNIKIQHKKVSTRSHSSGLVCVKAI